MAALIISLAFASMPTVILTLIIVTVVKFYQRKAWKADNKDAHELSDGLNNRNYNHNRRINRDENPSRISREIPGRIGRRDRL